jgi:hypothetical protein
MRTTDEDAAIFCADQLAKCCYGSTRNLQGMADILDECNSLPDALSMLSGRDERALKAISTLHAHFIADVWRSTTGAVTVTYNERDMAATWPIVKRHFHAILTNQGLGQRLTQSESTAALRELRAESAKIANHLNNQ